MLYAVEHDEVKEFRERYADVDVLILDEPTKSLDPVGAGDSFISALAASLAAGATACEAGAVANLAAGVNV